MGMTLAWLDTGCYLPGGLADGRGGRDRHRRHAATEAVNISSKQVHLGLAQPLLLCRHHIVAAVAYGFGDGFFRVAVEPVPRRSDWVHPCAIMPLPSAPWQPPQTANFPLPASAILASCFKPDSERTYCVSSSTPFSPPMAAPSAGITPYRAAVEDGGLDRHRIAAVQPVAIAQIGEALCAAGVGAVALRAVVEEQPLPHGVAPAGPWPAPTISTFWYLSNSGP